MEQVWAWVAGLITISLFSFIYKENRVYRLMEHIYVGCTAGYAISVNFRNVTNLVWIPLTNGTFLVLIPATLGVLMFTRFFKPVAYLSRWTTAFVVALGTGLALYGVANAQLLTQITASFLPLIVTNGDGAFMLLDTINNWIMVFGMLSVLAYFFFFEVHQPALRAVAKGGRFLMMISFGVAFGNGVMMNMSLLLGCFETILGGMLGLI